MAQILPTQMGVFCQYEDEQAIRACYVTHTLLPVIANLVLSVQVATLLVRPRGLHLPEKHFLLSGQPIPGCLLDFGLYFFHNAKELLERGSGPYFYLPKMQDHLEARSA